jgi:hypothetical protein
MSIGLPAYTSIGSGTMTNSPGSGTSVTAFAVTPNSSTLQGDLVVWVISQSSIAARAIPVDLGDGWILATLETGNSGISLAICIAPRAGSSGWAGLSTGTLQYVYCSQCHTFRLSPPARWDIHNARFSSDSIFASGSGTALDAPAINQPYQQVIDILGRSYNNAGATTTVANVTNFTERFDTGIGDPGYSIAMNDRTGAINGSVQNASVTSALAVAKQERCGLRVMVPIVGNTMINNRARYGQSRRAA